MRFIRVLSIVIVVLLAVTGCGMIRERAVPSETLITVPVENIDRVQVDYVKEDAGQSTNKEVIGRLYKALSGIPVEKIPTEQEINLMKNVEMEYLITFVSKRNAVGHALVFANGDMVMPDLRTVDETKPTQSYVHYKLSEDKLKEIEGILEDLKEE